MRGLAVALGALLLVVGVPGIAGRLLQADDLTVRSVEERLLLDASGLVLSADASEADAGAELALLVGTEGQAVWPTTNDPSTSVSLKNASYATEYGGTVLFTAPAAGMAEAGTYGLSSELLSVSDGAWGDEFSAVVWYKPAGTPDPDTVLLQVAYAGEGGDWGSSATWRLSGFSDKTKGFVNLDGFQAAAPSWTVGADCWQQLAVVKAGPQLTFYYNKGVAGTASATFIVNDYGTASIVLGVDYAALATASSNATGIDATQLGQSGLGWLSGSLGMVAVYDRALDAASIAAIYDEQQAAGRYSEALCGQTTSGPSIPPPSPTLSLSPPTVPGVSPSPPTLPGVSPSPPTLPGDVPRPPTIPGVNPSPPTAPVVIPSPPIAPVVIPSPSPPTLIPSSPPPPPKPTLAPGSPPRPPSTLDTSTAKVEGSGTTGSVSNTLAITGGEELADFETNTQKQEDLKKAIVESCNLDPSYTVENVKIVVVKVEQRPLPQTERTVVFEYVVVCVYILLPTPVCPVEVLEKEEINVYLFIRVQQPTMPWWKGPTATICQCDDEGECNEDTPPVPPPVVIPECSSNICFLLDGSKSLFNVDAWNDVVAAARSIMYSISSPDAVFDVFWFSNEVEKIGRTVTGAEVAADNTFITEVLNTVPNAHGTFMAQAIGTCQQVLSAEESGVSKTIILITDGKPTDREQTLAAAEAAKAQGLKMVVVGAGEIDYETLKALASGPSFVFANYELDASQLLLLADLAASATCRELD